VPKISQFARSSLSRAASRLAALGARVPGATLSLLIVAGAATAGAPDTLKPPDTPDDDVQRAPVVQAVVDRGDYTPETGSMTANWIVTGQDITEYRYAIGTSPEGTNIVPWTSAGLNTSVTRSGLSLRNDTRYYFSVRAYNAQGETDTGSADGITVDTGVPTLGAVVDEGAYTATPNKLTFSFSGNDAESGVKEYFYAIGTGENYEGIVPWTSSGLVTSRTVSGLNLVEGEAYYVSVYVIDQAGNVAFGYSDGIEVDVSAPRMGYVIDAGAVTPDRTELAASWGASDPMGVTNYSFAIGTSAGGSNVAPWKDVGLVTSATVTGLSLEPNRTYYVTVKATDASGRTAQASSDGIRVDDGTPFVIDDVRMGDSQACYTNPEQSDNGRYMVWGERINKLNDAGEGVLRMWHCAIDPESGGFIPHDCRGFNGFDSTNWGRAYLGRDRNGHFYLGANENYELVMTRITGAKTGTTTVLGSLKDPERRAIYPSVLPESGKIYAYWLKSHGETIKPLDAEWVELRYVDIDDPTHEIVVDRQENTDGVVPMDVTFPRWAFKKPLLLYGDKDSNGFTNIYQLDVSRPSHPPVKLTDDWHGKAGPYPIAYNGKRYIITGIDGETESLVYEQPAGGGLYEVVDSFAPPPGQTFRDACLSNSHQPFISQGKLYSSYQITNCKGEPPEPFAFLSYPGQIWFTRLLAESEDLRLVSLSNTWVRNEPEPVIGAGKAWIFYSAYPEGYDQTDACAEVRRTTTPIGMSAP
jgi:hypothetical protein